MKAIETQDRNPSRDTYQGIKGMDNGCDRVLIDVFYRSPLPVASSARFYNSVSRREKSTVCCVLLRRIFFVANNLDLIYNLACFDLQTASQYPIL